MNQNAISDVSCKLCRNDQVKFLYQSRRYGFRVGRCPGCGLTFVVDRIAEAHLKEIYDDEQSFERFSDLMRNARVRERHHDALREICQLLQGSSMPGRLLDIGAGSGEFLNHARELGFEIYGNELSNAAICSARQRYGISLSPVPLEQELRTGFFDVITMWGLIEHVLDPLSIIKQAFRLLRCGGILYIYTPVWCLYDDIGLRLAQFCGWTRLLDRRITLAHLQLFTIGAMHKILTAIGFELCRVELVCEYNLPVTAYLESLGVPTRVRSGFAAALDWLIDRGLFFRNNMRVFCRKPLA
jgi:2-polyprenyl-3-methyl-5-hydroxy-6-metoxy-1,4-benzoquinol methylase